MLENKVIIYDDSCPMCKLYTYWFVAWGFLGSENRIGFATAPADITSHVDLDRGRHEIPLFDRTTKETIYGLAALTHVLGSRWTWLNPFFESRVFMWMFYPLYQIITYNRRVIAGCQACCGFDCAPDLNRFYRSVYLLIAGFAIFLIGGLLAIHGGVEATLNPFNAAAWLMIAFAIVGVVVAMFKRFTNVATVTWDYLGNHATSLLIVALTLIPMLMWSTMPTELAWVNVLTGTLLGMEEMWRRSFHFQPPVTM